MCYSETACQEMLQVTVANLLTFENQIYVLSPEKRVVVLIVSYNKHIVFKHMKMHILL